MVGWPSPGALIMVIGTVPLFQALSLWLPVSVAELRVDPVPTVVGIHADPRGRHGDGSPSPVGASTNWGRARW